MPFSGWFLMNSLRMICRTFIDWLAHSMRFLPRSASSIFAMSQATLVGVVAIVSSVSSCAEGRDCGGVK